MALTVSVAAFVVAYHPNMAQAVFLPSFVYDVLCFTFYFLAIDYYLSIRASGRPLRAGQIAGFLLLYVGALESKDLFSVLLAAITAR